MEHFGKAPAWLLSGVILGLSARLLIADTSDNPYRGIAGSNVFRLRAPPRQEPAPPAALLPKVTTSGITTMLPGKRVLLKVSYPSRSPEPAKEVSSVLTVGQREGPIEVLAIDETAGSVKVNNSGTIMVLTLDRDSPRPQPAPMPPNLPPGPPPGPRQPAPLPPALPPQPIQ